MEPVTNEGAAERGDERSGRVLAGATVAVGVLTAGLIGLLAWSPLGVLPALLPPALGLVPLFVPRRYFGRAALVLAVVVTATAVIVGGELGVLYFPMALFAWAAALLPGAVARGLDLASARWVRGVLAGIVALPALAALGGFLTSTIGVGLVGTAAIVFLVLVAAGVGLGVRTAAAVLAIAGAALLMLTLWDRGMLLLGFWWVGAVYAACGLSAWLAWSPSPGSRPLVSADGASAGE